MVVSLQYRFDCNVKLLNNGRSVLLIASCVKQSFHTYISVPSGDFVQECRHIAATSSRKTTTLNVPLYARVLFDRFGT